MGIVPGGPVEILHVEDEPDFADLCQVFLTRHNDQFRVNTAAHVPEALTELRKRGVDCIISDFDMPGESGLDLLKTVRETEPELPFILFTGKGSEEIASDAISAGVTDYLQKGGGTEQFAILANRIQNTVEQYRSQQELVRHQDLLQHTEQLADTGGWEANVETGEQRWTEGTYEIHDISPTSGFDPTVDAGIDFYHEDDRDVIANAVERCMTDGEPYDLELRLHTADDRMKWVHTTGEPVRERGTIVAIRGAIRDVTDEVAQRRELEEMKARYEAFVDLSNDIITVVGDDGTIRYESPAIESLLGYTQDDLVGENVFDYVHPDDQSETIERFESVFDSATTVTERASFRFKHANGEWVWLEAIGSNRAESAVAGYVINSRDITERKRRERELERYRAITHAASNTIITIDESSRIRSVNPVVEDTFGYDREELVGKHLSVLMSDETAEQHRAAFERYLETGEKTVNWSHVEVTGEHRNGTSIPLAVSFGEVTFDGQRLFVGILRDITERQGHRA